MCGEAPEPHVLHSVGLWGAYFWVDLTSSYYGVYVHSWAIGMRNFYWIGTCLSTFMAALVFAQCAMRKEHSQSDHAAAVVETAGRGPTEQHATG